MSNFNIALFIKNNVVKIKVNWIPGYNIALGKEGGLERTKHVLLGAWETMKHKMITKFLISFCGEFSVIKEVYRQ